MIIWNNELYHYGVPRRSGRYPWGSGENPYHHGTHSSAYRKKRKQLFKDQYAEEKNIRKEARKNRRDTRKDYKNQRISKEQYKQFKKDDGFLSSKTKKKNITDVRNQTAIRGYELNKEAKLGRADFLKNTKGPESKAYKRAMNSYKTRRENIGGLNSVPYLVKSSALAYGKNQAQIYTVDKNKNNSYNVRRTNLGILGIPGVAGVRYASTKKIGTNVYKKSSIGNRKASTMNSKTIEKGKKRLKK